MTNRILPGIAAIGMTLTLLMCPVRSAVAQESQPGLVAVYSDENSSVVRVVPTPNLRLRSTESIHPQIDRQFTAAWTGVLKIDRAGQYRVYADRAKVQVAGKPVAERTTLATGEHAIRIQFQRESGEARLDLRWESEFFQDEPVPSAALGHVETPETLASQDSIEQGRFLFAELGCANCHSAGNWNLQSRRGPDLSDAGSRVTAEWLYAWLKNPHDYRKSAVMPVCLDSDQDRADVTAFVMTLRGDPEASGNEPGPDGQITAGQELFESIGCVKCHDKNNSLDAVGMKYRSLASLTEFLTDPHKTDPHGRMPSLFNAGSERHFAAAVARFLFSGMQPGEPLPTPPSGDAVRGSKLFTSSGCVRCHTVAGRTARDGVDLAGPAFGQPTGLPLRHFWDFGSEGSSTPVKDRVTGSVEKIQGREAIVRSNDDRERSFEFDGKTFIELTHFHRPDTMTISVWVKTTQGGSILTWGRPGGSQRGSRELRMNIGQDGNNSVCYGEYNSDGGWKPVIVKPAVDLIDDKWHHIAVVRKGESIQHFVDGKPAGSGKALPGGGDYTDRLLIGALGLSDNPTNRFKGRIDDLSIWEMALSDAQIAALASGSSPLTMARPAGDRIQPFNVAAGCLGEDVQRPLPDYRLSKVDRSALRNFLATVQPEKENSYQASPLTTHDLRIRQFRCTACHELDDQNIQKGVEVDDNGRVVRVERPPLLTGAGAKLTGAWIREVLVERKRNRPWLNLRMPHFGEGVSEMPDLIASAAGASPYDAGPKPDRSLAEAGLEMIGVRRGKVSCITCHDYRGINRRKDGVVPAPDLADAGRTVRREWFDRWMHDPQRLQPGTSMPQLFLDVPAEERDLRIAQLWSALYYQKQLPLPNGVLDQQTEGTRIVVKDKPVIFRMATVTPVGQIDRAINVGMPGGFNFTFDAVSCRLVYAWQGEFLDAGPAWNGRGGNPVKAGGGKLVEIKSGNTIRVGAASESDSLRFLGYRLEDHSPVFRYEVNGVQVEQRIEVSQSKVAQKFVVRKPAADVLYQGAAGVTFESKTGQREGDLIRFPSTDVVEFEIDFPVGSSSN